MIGIWEQLKREHEQMLLILLIDITINGVTIMDFQLLVTLKKCYYTQKQM